MPIRRALFALFAGLALTACTPTRAAENDDVAITLTRSVCFGFCPAYRVTIHGDGEVVYVGERFVNVRGEQRARIPREDVERLLLRFEAVRFAQLRDEYRAQVTDLPTYTVTLGRDGQTKSVLDYGGLSAGMPQAVRDLQDEIDRVANTARWVQRDGQPVREP